MSTTNGSDDFLLRGLALGGRARVVAARTTRTLEALRGIHEPTPTVAAAIGRVATGALLLAASLEKVTHREPVLTLEVEGDGPAGKIWATASPAGWVRALVKNPHIDRPPRPDGKLDVGGVVGASGFLGVARDLGYGQPYRGIVPLVSGEIAEDLASYLNESEQAPAAVGLGVFVGGDRKVGFGGGYVVQLLPGVSDHEAAELHQNLRDLGAVTDRLRAGDGPDEWLTRMFPGGVEVIERRGVEFRCGCSRDRVERALKLLGAAEIEILIAQVEAHPVDVTCEFCRTRYGMPREDLARLRLELESERPRGGAPAIEA